MGLRSYSKGQRWYSPVSILGICVIACLYLLLRSQYIIQSAFKLPSHPSKIDGITVPVVLTLHFNTRFDSTAILHNCLAAKSINVRMIVHTEYMSAKYCGVCACLKFEEKNCPSPEKGKRRPSLCEKMNWMANAIQKYREFIFLDADLIVMYPREFFRGMASRAIMTDFLATYAHGLAAHPSKYLNDFNSGMMFIRHIPSANYTDLVPTMYRSHTGNDQGVLARFIHKYYGMRWDTLSWKWHCITIIRLRNDVNPAHCLTIHDRDERKPLLKQLNRTMLTLPPSREVNAKSFSSN